MIPNRAKIVITNPCSENWNSMSVHETGRFCQSCQKSVIDFSSKSDEEIRDFLKDKTGEKLCGRFFTHQVERIRIEIDGNLLTSGIPFWQKFLVIVLVCFGNDFLGTDFVFAQTQTDSVPIVTEQVDSLITEQPAKADSAAALEATTDSLLIKQIEFKQPEEWRFTYPIVYITATMGMFSIVEEEINYPERVFHIPHEIKLKVDSVLPQSTTERVSKPAPVVPKDPERKPAPPQNAIIADTGERKKTRRS